MRLAFEQLFALVLLKRAPCFALTIGGFWFVLVSPCFRSGTYHQPCVKGRTESLVSLRLSTSSGGQFFSRRVQVLEQCLSRRIQVLRQFSDIPRSERDGDVYDGGGEMRVEEIFTKHLLRSVMVL